MGLLVPGWSAGGGTGQMWTKAGVQWDGRKRFQLAPTEIWALPVGIGELHKVEFLGTVENQVFCHPAEMGHAQRSPKQELSWKGQQAFSLHLFSVWVFTQRWSKDNLQESDLSVRHSGFRVSNSGSSSGLVACMCLFTH